MKAIPPKFAYLAVFIAVIGHASSEFLAVYSGISGPEVSVWRYSLGSLGLIFLALLSPSTRDLMTPLREVPVKLVLLGFFGITLTYLAFHWALDFATVVQVGTTVTTMPIFVGLINQWVNREKLSIPKIVGGLCAVAGIALLLTDGYLAKLAGSGEQLIGMAMALFCAALGSTYIVLVKPLIIKYGPIQITTVTLSIGGVGLWIIVGSAWGIWVNPANVFALPPVAMWSLLTLAFFNTSISQILFFGGIAAAKDPTRASFIFFLKPVIAALLAFFFLSQPVTGLQILAIIIVCGSIAGEAIAGRIMEAKNNQ